MAAAKNNRYNQVYNLEQATELFLNMLEYAKTDDCLCIQDAVLNENLPISTFYSLIKQHKDLEDIKKDIDAAIISKVNKGGLTGDFNPTASIWRMKQLGERDERDINSNIKDQREKTSDLFPDEDDFEDDDE
jgi:hypothetical protein